MVYTYKKVFFYLTGEKKKIVLIPLNWNKKHKKLYKPNRKKNEERSHVFLKAIVKGGRRRKRKLDDDDDKHVDTTWSEGGMLAPVLNMVYAGQFS